MTQTDIQDNNANKIKAQDKINIIRAKYICLLYTSDAADE